MAKKERPMMKVNKDMLAAIDKAFKKLVEQGVIVDSGERKWSDRTLRYEIVWIRKEEVTGH